MPRPLTETLQGTRNPTFRATAEALVKAARERGIRTEIMDLAALAGLFAGATAGRVALQHVPSLEPIIPFAIIAGAWFGFKEAFAVGSGAYVTSNFFVWGLHGPWTLPQAVGAGVAGIMGAFLLRVYRRDTKTLVTGSVAGTLFYEVLLNATGPLMGVGLFTGLAALPLYLVSSLPFSATHVLGNAFFALALSPLLKFGRKRNGFEVKWVARVSRGTRTAVGLYRGD